MHFKTIAIFLSKFFEFSNLVHSTDETLGIVHCCFGIQIHQVISVSLPITSFSFS